MNNKRIRRFALFTVLLLLGLLISGCKWSEAEPMPLFDVVIAEKEDCLIVSPASSCSFKSPYLLYIPQGNVRKTPVLCVFNSGFPTEYQYDLADLAFETGDLELIKELFPGRVIIMPLYERFEGMYTHALAKEALQSEGDFARLDLQTEEMIKDAQRMLSEKGIDISDKVISFGFSAAGQFAHRFALLRPSTVALVVAGGLGSQFTIPDKVVNGYCAFYPVGIFDLEALGITYDNSYLSIPQFIFQGEDDDNDVVFSFDGYSGDAAGAYYGIMSMDFAGGIPGPAELFDKSAELTKEYCPNITFRLYKGLGHDINEEVKTDIKDYVKANLKEE